MAKSEGVYGLSPLERGLKRFRRNRVALFSLWVLGILYAAAVFAGFFSPYDYDDERRDLSYHPPSRVHLFDAEGRFRGPFVYATSGKFDAFYRRAFIEDRARLYPLRWFEKGAAYRVFGILPFDRHLVRVDEPARLYLLGADSRGRDLWTRTLFGAQVSLSIGLIGVAISFTIGLIVGGLSGYLGGRVDDVLMRVCEMMMMAPGFYLLLALRAAFPPQISSVQVYWLIVVILSFIGWAGLARVVRGLALSLRQREFVTAARLSGRPTLAIITQHLIPNMASYAVVAATLSVPGYILGETSLSLLGLGIQDPQASWGNLLSDAMGIAQLQFHPWILWPGFFIAITVMAYNFLGDGLRDAFDPRLEGSAR